MKQKISKKLKIFLGLVIFAFILLIARLFYLQIITGDYLTTLATSQQTTSEVISSTRGNIYDSTGAALAISETVDTISVNPSKIDDEEDKKLIAKGLSEIFDLDYDELLEDLNSDSTYITVAEKVEEDKVSELEEWMNENDISSEINIDEDSTRYYPYGTLASQVIGVCGTDNQGLSGIEYSYDSILTGTSGQIVTSVDSTQSEIPNSIESFIEAEDGYDLTLTIDANIQTIAEKYLEEAVDEYECEKGGNVIIMDPNTGDILAMASYPDYDLNDPYTPTSYYADDWDELSSDEKLEKIYQMWRVRSVSETYEPGSVFKLITGSVALEEAITTADVEDDFYCDGYQEVEDRTIRCWNYANPHGYESLRDAIKNSCNPALIQLSQRIGADTLYKYYEAFGFFDETNVGLSGEASGIFFDLEDVGLVELATMSFGQRFTITPLQMITAVSAIANGGYLMQPRLVDYMTNSDTGEVIETDITSVRQVLSAQTCETMLDIMEDVVTDSTGKTAAVEGYEIAGKSGTSEPTDDDEDSYYVASFVAVTPVSEPQLVILVTLYDPQGSSHEGSQTAGPTVSKILADVLPYLGIEPTTETE